jgi:hypothetical protein
MKDNTILISVLSGLGVGIFISLFVSSMPTYKVPVKQIVSNASAASVVQFKEPFIPPLISGPANPGLSEPRKPYALLDLPLLGTNSPSQVNSQNCREMDFSRVLEKSSYGQITNNFKREFPDSCSAPYQEVVLGIYKPEPFELK